MAMDNDVFDMKAMCIFWGGSKPVNPATIYRGIKRGDIPPPMKIGQVARWLRSENEKARARLLSDRDRARNPGLVREAEGAS